ncbi:TetR/AcrR family transcriptional regulator [Phenylobacterium sp.]|uniref:TetR/AcrR family transcriptional regulator n=1 Tax=Phenylobacterium sp. TaxID=1871053 RepID=UPI002FE21113
MKADVGPQPGASGARASQREATRNRVLNAARELFDTSGYQGTTIREIARHAGVSVGSVFTTFASKGEILSQVMQDRLEPLYAELDRVVPHLRGSTADRLRSMFAIHFAFEAPRARLFLAHIAAAYDWTLPPTARPYGHTPRLQDVIRDCLAKGVEAGDVDPAADPQEIIDLLMAAYAWTWRLAITRAADARAMTEAMDRQIGLICEGFRPR